MAPRKISTKRRAAGLTLPLPDDVREFLAQVVSAAPDSSKARLIERLKRRYVGNNWPRPRRLATMDNLVMVAVLGLYNVEVRAALSRMICKAAGIRFSKHGNVPLLPDAAELNKAMCRTPTGWLL